MKPTSILFACLFLPLFMLAQNGHEIKVKADGFKGHKCLLAYHYGPKQYIQDTVEVTSDWIVFKGDEKLKGGIYLVVFPPENKYFEIMVADDQHFSLETKMEDFVKYMKVTGSKENKVFYDDLNFLSEQRQKAQPFRDKIAAWEKSMMPEESEDPDAEPQPKPEIEDTPEITKLREKLVEIDAGVKAQRVKVMKENPDLFYSKLLGAMKEPEVPEEVPETDENGNKIDEREYKRNYYLSHYFEDTDFGEQRLLRTPVLHRKVFQYVTKLTLQHPDSVIRVVDMLVTNFRGDINAFKKDKGETYKLRLQEDKLQKQLGEATNASDSAMIQGQIDELGKKLQPLIDNHESFKYFVVMLLNEYGKSKIMCMDKVYVHMVKKYYMTRDALWATEKQIREMEKRALFMEPTLCDKVAPNINIPDEGGTPISLHAVPERYTILYFWDYDCGHCKKVTPKLAQMYKKFKGKGIAWYNVSVNGDNEIWKEKLKEYEIDGINTADPKRKTGFDGLYDLRSTPKVFILDENKKIIAKQLTVEQIEKLLNELLEEDKNRK